MVFFDKIGDRIFEFPNESSVPSRVRKSRSIGLLPNSANKGINPLVREKKVMNKGLQPLAALDSQSENKFSPKMFLASLQGLKK